MLGWNTIGLVEHEAAAEGGQEGVKTAMTPAALHYNCLMRNRIMWLGVVWLHIVSHDNKEALSTGRAELKQSLDRKSVV